MLFSSLDVIIQLVTPLNALNVVVHDRIMPEKQLWNMFMTASAYSSTQRLSDWILLPKGCGYYYVAQQYNYVG